MSSESGESMPHSHPQHRADPAVQVQVAAALKNLQHAVAQCNDAVFFMDETGVITRVNLGFEKFTGYHSLELVGRDLSWVLAGGAHSTAYRSLWKQLFEDFVFTGDLQILRKDRRVTALHTCISAVRDRRGKVVSLVATGTPTHSPIVESPNAPATDSLNNADLQKVAHDLNNLLMVIYSRVEVIASCSNQNSAWMRQLREIQTACSRAIEVVRRLTIAEVKTKAQTNSG